MAVRLLTTSWRTHHVGPRLRDLHLGSSGRNEPHAFMAKTPSTPKHTKTCWLLFVCALKCFIASVVRFPMHNSKNFQGLELEPVTSPLKNTLAPFLFTWSDSLKPIRLCVLTLTCTSYKRKMWACQCNYNYQSNKTESHPNGLHFGYPPILGKTWLGEAVWVITCFVWHTLPSINWEWQAAQCSRLASQKELLQGTIHIGPLGLKGEAEPTFWLQMEGEGEKKPTDPNKEHL